MKPQNPTPPGGTSARTAGLQRSVDTAVTTVEGMQRSRWGAVARALAPIDAREGLLPEPGSTTDAELPSRFMTKGTASPVFLRLVDAEGAATKEGGALRGVAAKPGGKGPRQSRRPESAEEWMHGSAAEAASAPAASGPPERAMPAGRYVAQSVPARARARRSPRPRTVGGVGAFDGNASPPTTHASRARWWLAVIAALALAWGAPAGQSVNASGGKSIPRQDATNASPPERANSPPTH